MATTKRKPSKPSKEATAPPAGEITWTASQIERNSFEITVPYVRRAAWEWYALLTADRHWDNPSSDHELQRRHLDEARERGAAVLDLGDWFCAMQGKWDKRACKSALRPEHQASNYLDTLVNTASEFFAPYARNLVMIASGNHEEAISKRHETNLIERLVALLNADGAAVYHGGYSGYVRFRFRPAAGETSFLQRSVTLRYDHGYGGGGQVTKDVIQHNRRALVHPDADIIASGHTHDRWTMEFARQRISDAGRLFHDVQTHVKVPSYKNDFGDGFGGWAARSGHPPKPLGAYWLRFFFSHRSPDGNDRVRYELIPAN